MQENFVHGSSHNLSGSRGDTKEIVNRILSCHQISWMISLRRFSTIKAKNIGGFLHEGFLYFFFFKRRKKLNTKFENQTQHFTTLFLPQRAIRLRALVTLFTHLHAVWLWCRCFGIDGPAGVSAAGFIKPVGLFSKKWTTILHMLFTITQSSF